jgi:hypothetical protein
VQRLSQEIDYLSRRFEEEKPDFEARSRIVQGKLKHQISMVKKINRKNDFRPIYGQGRFSSN